MKLRPTLALMSLFSLLFGIAKADSLKVGDTAPSGLTVMTDSGKMLDLDAVYKKQPYTLVYFYPRALTPGCTAQGCSLRDAEAELTKKGVAIIGVSVDTVEKQKEFKDKYNFPFPLLSDTDRKVMHAFGQTKTGTADREAYLIKDGKIVYKDTSVTAKQGDTILAFLATQKG